MTLLSYLKHGLQVKDMIAELSEGTLFKLPTRAAVRLISHFFFQGRPVTTSNQWLNTLILAQFELVKRTSLRNRVNKPVFIIGTGRSGTTILGRMLSLHREVGFLNEPKALWYSVNNSDDLIGTYDRMNGRYWLEGDQATESIILAAHRLYSFYAGLTRSKRIVDKYPEMAFRTSFVKTIFPDAKFIFIVRNGWDTIQSISRWSANNGNENQAGNHDWWGVDGQKWRFLSGQVAPKIPDLAPVVDRISLLASQTDMAAVEWIATMQQSESIAKHFADDLFMLRYEDLTSNPRKVMSNVLEFCEIAQDEYLLKYAAKTISVNNNKGEVVLDPVLRAPFMNMMQKAGYLS